MSAAALVERQLELLHHRGPDARGAFGDDRARVAQNRLAVIDLESGDPPITNEDATMCAVLNGEVYDFATLREQLRSKGHRFSSSGDTEVLVHLAEEHPDAVELARRLDGMFAFAIWDERRGRLVLGRDRAGKKPLFYATGTDGAFVFASEIKAVLAHPAVSGDLDEGALPDYLTFGYVPTPRTIFRAVRSLPPAHVLTLEAAGVPRVERYWDLPRPSTGRARPSFTEAVTGVRSRLQDAVERRLVSDVPLGAFLSGGVDSSAIAALAARATDGRVSTFTMGFDDRDGFDERPFARQMAAHIGADHHEYEVRADAVELIERLVWHHDQPFGDSSAIPTFHLAEATRGEVTVALSGDGGDELFAGYDRFLGGVLATRTASAPAGARRALAALTSALPAVTSQTRLSSAKRMGETLGLGMPDAYLAWTSITSASDRQRLLGASAGTARDRLPGWAETEGMDPLARLLDLNFRTYLPDDLLVKADRMSMAHGLEVRSPFLDTALVEYAFRLPSSHKVRGRTAKRVLKAAVEDLMPPELLHRRKRGFGVPLDRWFRDDLAGYVESTLGAPGARVRELVAGSGVDTMIADHRSGRRNLGQALWTLLTLEVFLRERMS